MPTMVERKCEVCGVDIKVPIGQINRGRGKFCSAKCSASRFKTKAEVPCEQCGKMFSAFKFARDAGHGRFCSRECHHESKRKSRLEPCEMCGKECVVLPSNKSTSHFCSHECHRLKVQSPSLEERINQRLGTPDKNGCIPWTGSTNGAGYGIIRMGKRGRPIRAHRAVYELRFGKIPAGLVILHLCDNPRCVNIDHLRVGTNKDNCDDKVSKLRHRFGERTHFAKLTEDDVREIRGIPASESATSIARKFGVSRQTISRIRSRETWAYTT